MGRLKRLMVFTAALAVCFHGDGPDCRAADARMRIAPFPSAIQCWTFRAFTFIEALDRTRELGIHYVQAYPGQKLGDGFGDAVMDHTMSDATMARIKDFLKEFNINLFSYGVVSLGASEKDMRPVFDFAKKMGIGMIIAEPQAADFTLLEKLVREYDIKVAVHNHPEPNTYARPETVLARIRGRDARIGCCADTGHWMRTGIVPVEALRLLEGRILDVHLKDLDAFGNKEAKDVPFGSGKADILAILTELTRQGYGGCLTIEHENPADEKNPAPPIRAGLEYLTGYTRILGSENGVYTLAGWKHVGPGKFDFDEKTGVLTSEGGMGLLWYTVKQYGDFVLDLDYRCEKPETNSGVFIRVPGEPKDDSYIYHSFEIQIGDSEPDGIHATGAVYDAEAPDGRAALPTGEWNHLSVSFVGNHITVTLNGRRVVNWDAVPRGKVRDFAARGYVGLQNHDSNARVQFRNIYIKELGK